MEQKYLDPKFDRIKLAIMVMANPEYLAERGLRLNKYQQKDLRVKGLSQCNDCLIVKDLSLFSKNSNSISSYCKECKSQRKIKWYQDNRDHCSKYHRKWYSNNRDYILDYQRKYQENNADSHLENMRKYQKTPKGKLATKRQQNKRRAQKKKTNHLSYTSQQLQARIKLFNDTCLYCQTRLNGVYHLDHYEPLSRGGYDTLDNLVIACPDCNISKSDSNMVDWFFSKFGYSDGNVKRCWEIIDFVKRINGVS